MKTTLKIQVECGETTCAKEPGKFCRFFGTMRFGTIPICMLFPSDNEAFTSCMMKSGGSNAVMRVWSLREFSKASLAPIVLRSSV